MKGGGKGWGTSRILKSDQHEKSDREIIRFIPKSSPKNLSEFYHNSYQNPTRIRSNSDQDLIKISKFKSSVNEFQKIVISSACRHDRAETDHIKVDFLTTSAHLYSHVEMAALKLNTSFCQC